MDRRIRPWVNKKIIEYIGEEELTLTDFICSKVGHFFSTGWGFSSNDRFKLVEISVIFEL